MPPAMKWLASILLCCVTVLAAAQSTSQRQIIEAAETEMIGLPEIIDTRTFNPQINVVYRSQTDAVDNRIGKGAGVVQPRPNNMRVGGLLDVPREPKYRLWPAIEQNGWVPADPTLAVGPTRVVVTVNSDLAFYTKAGTKVFHNTFSDFIGNTTTTPFDPRAVYDELSQRFYILILEKGTSDGTNYSYVHILVSDDSDPTGIWYKYRINTKWTNALGQERWFDYPGFGFNEDAIVFSGNMFGFESGVGFGGVQFHILPKAPMLNGSAFFIANRFRDLNASSYRSIAQMAEINQAGVETLHGVGAHDADSIKATTFYKIDGTWLMALDYIDIPTFYYPTENAQSVDNRSLDTLDGRLLTAAWRGGRILSSHTVRTQASATNRVRWYEFNFTNVPTVNPTLVQSGEISGGASNHYLMPAINKNREGDISVLFTRSSSSIVADMMFSARYSTDPLGQMGTPVLLKTSDAERYTQSSGDKRWGDYFHVAVDPADDTTFWAVAMLAEGSAWRTYVYSWTLPRVATVTLSKPEIQGGTSDALTMTVTLSKPAGTQPVTVKLSDSSTYLDTPDSLTFFLGQTSKTVSVTHQQVTATKDVSVYATLGTFPKKANLKILPVQVASVAVSPTTVVGGKLPFPIGTVTLDYPAPTGGTVVKLTTNIAAALVPTSVTVAEGQTQKTFPVTTKSVASTIDVKITASNGTARETFLKVVPGKIQSVGFENKPVFGGSGVLYNGFVKLNSPAPPGGVVVTLTSDSTINLSSSTVTVAAGAVKGNFTYTVPSSVSAPTPAQVHATYRATATGTVTILPPKLIFVGMSRTTVVGGSALIVNGSVKINAPAPAGGITVNLVSRVPEVISVPATVLIPEGEVRATFPVTHFAVVKAQTVGVLAELNKVTRTASIRVTP